MRGLEKPAALHAGQAKPRIVFWSTGDTGPEELAALLRPKMRDFSFEVRLPLAHAGETDWLASLVLVHPGAHGDAMSQLLACRQSYPNAILALLVDAPLSLNYLALMQSGFIKGVVPFDTKCDVLVAVLNILMAGGEYCPPTLAMPVPPAPASTVAEEYDLPDYRGQGLTPRESQIMALIAEGLQNKLIAAQISLSEHTVKAHVRNLFTKLRVTNRTQAVAKCRGWQVERRRGLDGRTRGAAADMHLTSQ